MSRGQRSEQCYASKSSFFAIRSADLEELSRPQSLRKVIATATAAATTTTHHHSGYNYYYYYDYDNDYDGLRTTHYVL